MFEAPTKNEIIPSKNIATDAVNRESSSDSIRIKVADHKIILQRIRDVGMKYLGFTDE